MKIHCPNSDCLNFLNNEQTIYRKKGFYTTKTGTYQRYICPNCGRQFSDRTFSINYYLHFNLDYYELAKKIFNSQAMRSIALDFNRSTSAISRRIQQLSRNMIAAAYELEKNHKLQENLCADGIQNFNVSQYFPCDYNILVGEKSKYIYIITYSLMRRKGRMSKYQKQKRKEMYKGINYNQFSTLEGFKYLVKHLEKLIKSRKNSFPIIFHTDKKIEYVSALKQSKIITNLKKQNRFQHIKTSSKEFRDTKNKLFPVNYMDSEMRKNLAQMRRETTCFARNVCMSLDRLTIFAFFHNNLKKYKIKDPVSKNDIRHSHIAGFNPQLLEQILSEVFKKRYFFNEYKGKINEFNKFIWERKIPTPRNNKEDYIPQYALI